MAVTTRLLSGAFSKKEILSWPAWQYAEVVEDYLALEKLLQCGVINGSQLKLTKKRLKDPKTAWSITCALCEGGHTKLLSVVLWHQPWLAAVLLRAAKEGRSRAVVTLVAAGADVHVRDTDRCTPLHWAAEQCDVQAVGALLQAGAKSNCLDREKRTPLHWAAWEGNASVVRLLLHSAKVYLKDEDGRTPLHCAACTNSVKTARALLAAGANPTARDYEGKTPLHVAAQKGRANVVRLLLDSTDVDVTDDDGWTPLVYTAIYTDSCKTAEELLEAGADTSVTIDGGKTLLHLAAEEGHANLVRLLAEEIDVDVTDAKCYTPLHYAAAGAHSSAITELLEAGANTAARTDRGMTPLHVAAIFGHANVVRHLSSQ